jgi:hypothetical protein
MSLRRRVVIVVALSVAAWLVLTAAALNGLLPVPYMALALFGVVAALFYALLERPSRRSIARRAAGLCPECGYDLTGNVSGVCPECGAAATVIPGG